MKRFSALLSILASVILLTACGETEKADDHANWKKRNTEYIAALAGNFADMDTANIAQGQKIKILSFKLDPQKEWGVNSYVYAEVLKKGDGERSPYFSDSIRCNYRIRLIPSDNYPEGQVVDQSFKTATLDPSINIPTSFEVDDLIEGAISAVMYMHVGDFWKMYIPYQLGYGNNSRGEIPAYSALIFEVNLTEIANTGDNLSHR